nr:glycoside hydrolase family 3 N-terminal domain-containing protein [uncultured Flavobacterium sp.]
MTLEQKVGQFFFPAVFINDSEEHIQEMESLIKKYNIGGLTFFHSRASAATNYESNKKIEFNDDSAIRLQELIVRYQKCASTPLLMSIDAEWGLAMRVEKTPQYPYAITLGALPDSEIDLVYQVGKQIGLDLKSVGIHYNLAPLADVNNNPNNPVIGYRSFGEDKKKVADFAVAYLQGLTDAGVLGCLKHFPGHGNTSVDSHLGLPVLQESREELMENELVPFIEGIKNNVDSIMIGHLAVPSWNENQNTSATLSKNIIETLLRKELGYKGLVISDALNMHSVSKLYEKKGQLEWEAFHAGNDVLCFAENVAEGIDEIVKNASLERINASFERIMQCKEKVGILDIDNQIDTYKKIDFDFSKTSEINTKIAQLSVTTILDSNNSTSIFEAQKKNSLAKVSFYKEANNYFFNTLASELPSSSFSYTIDNANLEVLKSHLDAFETVLIALFVPKAKPLHNFEIEDSVLHFLSELLQNKNCFVYTFGNPYALQIIPNLKKAKGLVHTYQDFKEFQEITAEQLLNNDKSKGTLPVKINML